MKLATRKPIATHNIKKGSRCPDTRWWSELFGSQSVDLCFQVVHRLAHLFDMLHQQVQAAQGAIERLDGVQHGVGLLTRISCSHL